MGGFQIGTWSRVLRKGVGITRPGMLPVDNAAPITNFPRGLWTPAALPVYASLRAGPPPTPREAAEWTRAADSGAPYVPFASSAFQGFAGGGVRGAFRYQPGRGSLSDGPVKALGGGRCEGMHVSCPPQWNNKARGGAEGARRMPRGNALGARRCVSHEGMHSEAEGARECA